MVGQKAVNFTLLNSDRKKITLAEEVKKGKVLLVFFPFAFSSVCTDELCTIRDNMKLYNSFSTNVLAISVDSFFTLREFKKSYNLNFTLLSDFNKSISKQFNALYEDYYGMIGVSKRAAFVINQNLNIEYAEILEDSGQQPDFKAIRKALSIQG